MNTDTLLLEIYLTRLLYYLPENLSPYNIYRRLPAKISNLSFGAKPRFDTFAVVKTARVTRENFQAHIQLDEKDMVMCYFGELPLGR